MLKKAKNTQYIIFTDLDGTLLNKAYSFKPAEPVLNILKKKKIPVIFCSAKTKAEQSVFRRKMRLNHPIIVENGSAVYVPKNYFKQINTLKVVLGIQSDKIKKEIKTLQRKYKIKGYKDMTAKQVAEITGLKLGRAKLAKKREFGETVVESDKKALKELKKEFNVVSGGRFIQVFGKKADKGKAVKLLTQMYKKEFGKIITIGLGDSENDKPMLKNVDIPILVKNGPQEWAKSIKRIILHEK